MQGCYPCFSRPKNTWTEQLFSILRLPWSYLRWCRHHYYQIELQFKSESAHLYPILSTFLVLYQLSHRCFCLGMKNMNHSVCVWLNDNVGPWAASMTSTHQPWYSATRCWNNSASLLRGFSCSPRKSHQNRVKNESFAWNMAYKWTKLCNPSYWIPFSISTLLQICFRKYITKTLSKNRKRSKK